MSGKDRVTGSIFQFIAATAFFVRFPICNDVEEITKS